MGSINRGTLPQNFLDSVTNRGLSLPEPQPQYWFAHAAMAGRLNASALDAGASTVQQFISMMGGGEAMSPELSRLVRTADMFPGILQGVEHFGLGKGDTIKFQRPKYSGGGYTKAARELRTNVAISTTGQSIQEDEIPVVLKQYHGPGDSNGNVNPYAINEFDAKYRANKHRLADKTSHHLQRDYVKWLDTVVRDEFSSCDNLTFPSGIADASGFSDGGGAGFDLETIMTARKTLSDREWLKFPNGRYVALVPTSFNTDMVSDANYREMSKVHADGRNLLYGYIGSVQDVDIIEVSTLQSYAPGATLGGQTVAAGVTLEEGMLIGPGAVGIGTGLPPEARWADDTNYGTVAKLIWYAIQAIEVLDDRGVQKIIAQSDPS